MNNLSDSQSSAYSPNADQVRGGLRIMDDFMRVAESFFERIYRSVSHNRKVIVERERVRQWQSQSKAYQKRIRVQNLELAQLTGVLAAVDQGVILQNTAGHIVLMNATAREYLGSLTAFWDSELGKLFRQHVNPHPNPTVAGMVEPLIEPQRIELGGRTLGISLAAVYSTEGDVLGTVMLLGDVATDALADKLKTSFITQMSHELLTPLTSIKGMSDLMLSLPEGRPPNRRFLETISRNVAIMDRMVVELLDITEISSGSFTIRHDNLNMATQIDHILQGFAPQVKKANVNLTLLVGRKPNLQFLGDERRIQWAIGHLIDNAIKYTEAGGFIRVELRTRGNELLIKVRDTGVGISNDDLPNIFDRFYRGQAWSPAGKLIDPRGLGQGLYVAKSVTEAHNGTLSVASKQGQGTTFTLTLPLA